MKRVVALLILVGLSAAVVGLYLRGQPADAEASPSAAASSQAQHQGSGSGAGRAGRSGGGAAIAVTVQSVQQQTVPITAASVGYIEAPNVVVLRARTDGIVLQQNVTEGQQVKAGDVLFKLDDTAAQALVAKDQAAVSKDQAVLDAAQKDLTRDTTLLQDQSGTQQATDQQTATVKSAQAALQMDNAQLKTDQLTLSYMTITAPIAGRVGQINTAVGNVVRAADTSTGGLLTITQMSSLEVAYAGPERDLDKYRAAAASGAGAPVKVSTPDDSAPRATASLSFIDSSVDQTSGTVTVKAQVTDGGDKLWPGQYVNVVTQLGSYQNATTVPLIAVQQGPSGTYVFAVDANNTVKEVPVTVKATTPSIAVLDGTAGLNAGDKVVTEGQLRLADGSSVSTSDAQTASSTAPATAGSGGGKHKSGAGSSSAASSAPASSSAQS
jgi:multidrug efflux system membrane fusion protein